MWNEGRVSPEFIQYVFDSGRLGDSGAGMSAILHVECVPQVGH